MNINRDNYEQFFIDYYDQNLSKSQIEELFLFIETNADAKEEFFAYSPEMTLAPENISFDAKIQLKQIDDDTIVSANNFDKFCIAQLDGDLNNKQKVDFEKFISDKPDYSKEFNLYKKTILKADESIVYTRKYALKHFVLKSEKSSIKTNRIYWFASAVAASILLYFMLKINNSEQEKIISDNTNNIKFENLDSLLNQYQTNNQIANNNTETNNIVAEEAPVIERKKENIKKIQPIQNFSAQNEVLAKSIDFVEVETVFVPNAGTADDIADNVENTQVNTKLTVKKNEPQTIWDLAQKGLVKFLKNKKLPIKSKFDNDDNLQELALNTKYLSVEHVFGKK
ncbi:MAG: hypothetical protein A2033_02655 [Bacteroidetes bacterium GWA2_31_9]|nr:MAG: hypothetical protein A2033_02655 [Bacteroidetes bacterium GWA2_31_9]